MADLEVAKKRLAKKQETPGGESVTPGVIEEAPGVLPAINWEPRMQFVEGSKWWEILRIDGDVLTCICASRNESRQFKKSEADRLTAEYRRLREPLEPIQD